MQKEIHSVLTIGVDNQKCFLVSIETIVQRGLFHFEIIGLANKTISESKQRILSAIDYAIPNKRKYVHKKIITLLSPAGIKKEGSHFDLPIAVSYIISENSSAKELFANVIILGELTLTGAVLSVKNINAFIEAGIQSGIRYFVIPETNSFEIISEDIYIWNIKNISEIIKVVQDQNRESYKRHSIFKKSIINNVNTAIYSTNGKEESNSTYLIDTIKECDHLKRALLICLAGKHHLLLVGEPGSGKSLIAKGARDLQPPIHISDLNAIQTEKIIENGRKQNTRPNKDLKAPFREPHHTSSYTEIIGNKNIAGEIILANKGILFLDEMSEINKRALEGLRQPLEDSYIQINQKEVVETDFVLVGAMNPCDCGFYKSATKSCVCTRGQIDKFQRKMRSPLFQRFDIFINNSGLKKYNHTHKDENLNGEYMYKEVLRVRKIQTERLLKLSGEKLFEEKTDRVKRYRHIKIDLDIKNEKQMQKEERRLLDDITQRYCLSKRERYSILRVARTIADIEGEIYVKTKHIQEASSLRISND